MERTYVVTGAASGIGAATAKWLRERNARVIACDLAGGDVAADLTTPEGRAALVEGVVRLSGGRIDAIVANAGGGPAKTSLALNFFGTIGTLDGLRPLLAASPAPRAVAVSSVAALRPPRPGLVEACLAMDETAAKAASDQILAAEPQSIDAALDLYGGAKRALQLWCRRAAPTPDWAGAGITLNVVALGFFDTPAAAYVLANGEARAAMAAREPLRGAFPGRPEEAAALLAWCAGPENTQLTGQVLYADGGLECLARPERPL